MLIYREHTFEGVDYTSVKSDENRYVIFNENEFGELWVRKEDAMLCTEGSQIPEDEPTEADKAEAYDILMGVSE